MKKLALALGLAGVLAASQAAAIPSFSLANGYTGPVKIKFSNWESFTLQQTGFPIGPGSENFGILSITSIVSDDGNNTLLWTPGVGGAELTGVFRDIIVSTVTPAGSGFNIQSTGGLLDIYINPLGSFAAAGGATQGTAGYTDAGCAPGDACYDGISNVAGGGLFLSLAWNDGIAGPGITIDGDLNGTTFPGTGDAAGYLDVTGGLYQEKFDTNTLPTPFGFRDIFVQNDFCVNGAPGCAFPAQGNWQLLSEDPARAFVPEPGMLGLVGLALLGVAGFRRRAAPRA